MKALSIRQPWAWLILHAGKDIENRDWPTAIRGHFLIHASKGMTRDEYEGALDQMDYVEHMTGHRLPVAMPPFEQLERGGIVGSAVLADCVTGSNSPWFFGQYGFVLRDAAPLSFVPYKGMLGFFEIPDSVLVLP